MNGFRSFSTSRIRILVFSKNIKAENERKTRLHSLSQVLAVLPGLNISRASIFLPISISNARCPWSMFMAARVSSSFGQPFEFDIQWELSWWVQYTWISIRCFETITEQSQQFTVGVQKWNVCYCRLTQSKPHRIPWFHVLDQAPHPYLISVGNRLIYSSK